MEFASSVSPCPRIRIDEFKEFGIRRFLVELEGFVAHSHAVVTAKTVTVVQQFAERAAINDGLMCGIEAMSDAQSKTSRTRDPLLPRPLSGQVELKIQEAQDPLVLVV